MSLLGIGWTCLGLLQVEFLGFGVTREGSYPWWPMHLRRPSGTDDEDLEEMMNQVGITEDDLDDVST